MTGVYKSNIDLRSACGPKWLASLSFTEVQIEILTLCHEFLVLEKVESKCSTFLVGFWLCSLCLLILSIVPVRTVWGSAVARPVMWTRTAMWREDIPVIFSSVKVWRHDEFIVQVWYSGMILFFQYKTILKIVHVVRTFQDMHSNFTIICMCKFLSKNIYNTSNNFYIHSQDIT